MALAHNAQQCPNKDESPVACSGTDTEQYSLAGQTECSQCPAGQKCPAVNESPADCDSGQYSLLGQLTCVDCPAGSKCPTKTDSPITCDGSSSEQYSLAKSTSCSQCPAGSKCLSIDTAPVECDSGEYSLAGDKVCTTCPAGSKCLLKTQSPTACDEGYYSLAKSTTCTQCPAGYECPTKTDSPIQCTGTTYALSGATSCTQCPAGSKCTRDSSPVDCDSGEYSLAGDGSCTTCPAGSKCPTKTSQPVQCDSGYYALSKSTTCTQCPAGFKCPTKDESPIQCTGTNYALAGSTSCTQCPAGSKCTTDSSPVECDAGQYSLDGDGICKNCPAGFKCPTKDVSPIQCTGTDYALAGQISCTQCPAGSKCTTDSSPVECDVGEYSLDGDGICKNCPAGSKCPTKTISPIECDSGFYSLSTSIACTQCPAGYKCPTKDASPIQCTGTDYALAGSTSCTQCPTGSKCTAHSSPIDCDSGEYSLAGDGVCKTCPAGSKCPTKTISPIECDSGYYSLSKSIACTQCPAGYKCPTKDASPIQCSGTGSEQYSLAQSTSCSQCPAGKKCLTADQDPIDCPTGYYSLLGDGYCTICPAGSKCPSKDVSPVACSGTGSEQYSLEGSTSCSQCPAGKNCPATNSAPIDCNQGEYALAGNGACTTCPAGSYCPSTTSSPIQCNTGQYALEKSTSCTECPAGYKCPTKDVSPVQCSGSGNEQYALAGSTSCSQCPAGKSCPNTYSTPTDCIQGYYSLAGEATCTPCPAGYSCLTTTVSPVACDSGYYSILGGGLCIGCPKGYQCPNKNELPDECDDGYYQSATLSTSCKECPAGYSCIDKTLDPVACSGSANEQYSPGLQKYCQKCPAGYACPSTSVMTSCAAGYYSIEGDIVCNKCPQGKSRFKQQINSLGSSCQDPTVLPVSCTRSQYSISGSTQCLLCPAGYECPNAASIPVSCQQGYFSHEGDGYCSICPAGSSCAKMTVSPVACQSGYYSIPGSTYCSVCPLGHYCPTPDSRPHSCPSGTYSTIGQTHCHACPIGKFCPQTIIAQPYDCPPGFYSSEQNQTSCTPCPPGFQCEVPSQNPKICDSGYFSFGSAALCTICPAGYYCPKGNKEPIVCPAGKFSPTGQDECRDCPDGAACLQSNGGGEENCQSGQYRVNDGTLPICRDCPPGHYCPTGSSLPTICESGTYALYNRSSCISCIAGSFCPQLGNAAETCPPGTYQPDSKKTFCYECPAGYYCESSSVSQPTVCPAGKYNPTANQTKCMDCPAGFFCPSPATKIPFICPSGYYSNSNQNACTKCESGYKCPTPFYVDRVECPSGFVSNLGSTYCFECPAGKSCTITNNKLEVQPCPLGQFSHIGSLTCSPCPAGKSCHSKDSLGQINCDEGYYSLEGEISCKPCPAGFKCPNKNGLGIEECPDGQISTIGSSKCYECPKGHYCPFKHLFFIEQCPPGTYSLGNQKTCTECPEHFECPHRDTIKPIKDGFFSPKGTSLALKCRAGWQCKMTGEDKYVKPCEIGYYSMIGASECLKCPPGSYCELPDANPILCPRGFYQDLEGQQTCKKCEGKTFTDQPGSVKCQGIPNGYQYGYGGFTGYEKCIYGTYSGLLEVNDDGLLVCQNSEAGGITIDEPKYEPGINIACPPGYWCNQQDENAARYTMFPCPAGFKSRNKVNAINRDEACSVCEEGYYCEGANIEPKICFRGHYCPKFVKSITQYPCPAGMYLDSEGKTSEEDCKICPIGYYCPEGSAFPLICSPGNICPIEGLKEYQIMPCPAGSYNPFPGKTTCETCPKGQYCPQGSQYPQLCPPGTYNDLEGQKVRQDCKTCPINHLCTVFGLTQYDSASQPKVENGYLSPAGVNHGQQLPCPPGTIDYLRNLTNPDQCQICDIGFACEPGTATSAFTRMRVTCEPGYYCPLGTTHDKQYPCPGGTYSAAHDLVSATQCLTCPSGYFCPPGSYQPYICPNGYFCLSGTENFQHTPCKNGTYTYKKGLKDASECTICPKGYFCKEFTIFPEKCPKGTYNDQEGAFIADNSIVSNGDSIITCKVCPAGRKCPFEGMIDPIPCTAGYYSPSGSQTCFECQEGHHCYSRNYLDIDRYKYAIQETGGYYSDGMVSIICPEGYFCPAGTRIPHKCPAGTYQDQVGRLSSKECITTPAGFYTQQRGLSKFQDYLCAIGYYCPQGSNSQFAYRCPRGFYNNQTQQSACKSCPAGFFCNETFIHPQICPQGHYCPDKVHEPLKCPVGTFGAALGYKDSASCQTCPPGQYCSQQGISSPDGLCDPGYYCKGGAKVPNPTDGNTGDVCQKGGFCEYGSKRIKECPPGTFNDKVKAKTQTDCRACLPGNYCQGSNLSIPTGMCEAGYYCPAGSTDKRQNPAEPGYFTKEGASSQEICEYGYYNPFTARSTCLECEAGFYCDEQGMTDNIKDCPRGQYCPKNTTIPTKCPIGTYLNQFNGKSQSDCKPCAPGKYCNVEGLIEPSGYCDQGYFCISGSTSMTPINQSIETYGPCPAGKYCPLGTSYPIPCPAGTFSSTAYQYSNTSCKPCTTGFYCSQSGLSAPTGSCDPGFYCPGGQISPRPKNFSCKEGEYCPAKSGLPTIVPAGYYQSMPFQSTYVICPKGYYCEEGSTQYKNNSCPPGYYCPAGTQYKNQYPCPAGKYQPLTGQYTCIDCDPGKYCNQTGLSQVKGDCSAGYYCKSGSATATPITFQNGVEVGGQCKKGYYCPSGSAVMRPCLPGQYCGKVGLDKPSGQCKAGYYCLTTAIVSTPNNEIDGGGICPAGYYCQEGSTVPIPCPVGTFSSLSGNTHKDNCTICLNGTYCESSGLSAPTGQCARGYYCPQGQKTPRNPDYICPIGYRCPLGSTDPISCSDYTYQDMKGQENCKDCPPGYNCTKTGLSLCGAQFYCPQSQVRQACPAGRFTFKYNASTINDCLACLPGYYCKSDDVTGIVILPCPAGVVCTSEATNSSGNNPCPAGYFCPAKTSYPRKCPPGKYCATTEGLERLVEPTGLCSQGYYCTLGASSRTPLDGMTGDRCPRGKYCPEGSFVPIACPIGTYNDQFTQTSDAACKACPVGYQCTVLGAETYDSICPIGFYCPGDNQVIPCPIGYYCPAKSDDPLKCPSGYYQPNPQQSSCLSCPTGFYCPQTPNATQALTCPKGFYCPVRTLDPVACGTGTFNPFLGQDSVLDCLSCTEGQYCQGSSLTAPTGQCNAGYYCREKAYQITPDEAENGKDYGQCKPGYYCPAGSGSMTPCPIGTINDNLGSTTISDCIPCPAGFYCNQVGASSATFGFDQKSLAYACEDGFICTGGAKSSRPSLQAGQAGQLCPAGSYCSDTQQIQCPISYYNADKGRPTCDGCLEGKYCNEIGMVKPYNCPAGHYCLKINQGMESYDPTKSSEINLNECQAGRYSEFEGNEQAEDCTECQEGQYCSGGGSKPDGKCSEGFYCGKGSSEPTSTENYTMGSANIKQGRCPQGYYCPAGTLAPIPCGLGTYNPYYQRSSCDPCPTGYYCNELGLDNTTLQNKKCKAGYYCIQSAIIPYPTDNTTGRLCRPGYYCKSGEKELLCPPGTYEHRYGSSQCQTCPLGYICRQGSIKPEPCPIGKYCPPDANDTQNCPDGFYGHTDRLYSPSQCAACPTGYYCQNGVIQGKCSAGYYCDTGAISAQDPDKRCPISHYCLEGTLYPKRCPNGGSTPTLGASQANQCVTCGEGFFCLENGDSQTSCPKGHYCLGMVDPEACPSYTYNNMRGRQSLSDCLKCPAGYICNQTGIADYKSFPCPRGYYCPIESTKVAIECPIGTYNNQGSGAKLEDCKSCPAGYYCPKATINPIPCKNGTYCPLGSSSATTCPTGNYCPSLIGSAQSCPLSFYCPVTGSDQYLKCSNGTYCAAKAQSTIACPNGYYGSSDPNNYNLDKGCIGCDAGFYSVQGANECLPCKAGYICLGNTSKSEPTEKAKDGGYKCPLGYYCPSGSYSPIACPRGTYGGSIGLKSESDCQKCSAGQYGDVIGLTSCKKCNGYTTSVAGASSCSCIGSNRVYLASSGQCVCKTGFEPAESGSNDDSDVDCTQKVYQACTQSQVQDQFGGCKSSDDCKKECNGGSGTITAGLGVCQCNNQTSADDICDSSCLAKKKQVTFTSDGQIKIYDPISKTSSVSSLSGVEGSLSCINEDTSLCQLVNLIQTAAGDFAADFTTSSALSTTSKRVLFEEFEQENYDDTNSHFKYHKKRRNLQTAGQDNYIRNPVVCLTQGSALLFENLSKTHYPVYLKDSLINTNGAFDYSQFTNLATKVKNGQNITRFIFSFQDPGVYVFGDSADDSKTTIVSIMPSSQKCPSGVLYEAKTLANLLKVGVAINKNIIYSPDWGFFIGIVAAVLGLILISVFGIGYVYRKSWAVKTYDSIGYQRKNYSLIKVQDPNEHDAIISINADTESFSFLNEGKEVLRSREQKKAKDAQEKLDKERKKKIKKQKQLEIEEVENLKDKLYKHLGEIKKLFGVDGNVEDDDENAQLLENDEELRAQKLFDQIAKLKEIIDENRRVLEGDILEDHQTTEEEKQRLEQEKKDREEFEQRQAEEEAKRIKELEYQRNHDAKQKKNLDQFDKKKNEVIGFFEGDLDRRKQDMLDKMEKLGVNLSKEDRERMMEQFDSNLGKIGSILEDDEAYQQDLLRRKLEERKNRRKKLQDKLQDQEKILHKKNEEFKQQQEEVESHCQDLNIQLDAEIAQERIQKKLALDDDIERAKIDKLQNFEDLLKESKNQKDFSNILDQYQDARKKVESELEKEKQKQEQDLDKALKNRRGMRRAQLEKEKAEKLKEIQRDMEVQTENDRKKIEELKNIIQLDDGSKQQSSILDKNIEKIIQGASHQSESQLNRKQTLRDKSDSLFDRLKKGLMTKLEKLMQQHSKERKEMERKMIDEGKVLDQEVQAAQNKFSDQLTQELSQRDELKKRLEQESQTMDEQQKKNLIEELKQRDNSIKDKLDQQNQQQDNALAEKLKQRRKRKEELAELEREMKSKQIVERELEEDIQNLEDKNAKAQQDRHNLEATLNELKMNLPAEELPYAIQRVLDEKHEAELNDLLVELFELKCRELQDEVFNVLEEKLHKQGAIQKEYQDKISVIQKLQDQTPDQEMKDNLQKIKDNLKKEEQKELQNLEWDYKTLEGQMEMDVNQRLIDKENQRLLWLKEKQLSEKQEVFNQYLPESNSIKEIINEINEDEYKELEEFKFEQEADKIKKIQDLERQQELINKEMEAQKERMQKMDAINQQLQQEEERRERERQNKLRRERMQESNMNSNAYIEKLKRDLEKINEQLDSAISSEKQRQLTMMQKALEAKMVDAERVRQEEEEKFRLEEEAERKRQEEEEIKKKEEEAAFSKLKEQTDAYRIVIDKKKYHGPGKMENINKYYEALMRKKENQYILKMNTQLKSSHLANHLANNIGGQILGNLTSQLTSRTNIGAAAGADGLLAFGENSVSKEQQLKMLNEILTKIEGLESQVKKELALARPKQSKFAQNTDSKSQLRSNRDGRSMFGSTMKFRDDVSVVSKNIKSRKPSVMQKGYQ
ncbi:cast multi-domain protein [Stylonychia lemnae]|uniref:Cast multi-domain protein n=1 Tax=Stylonychia lemnae TaxID=5949 RepID=A0A077ZYD5_STYLE|nr:cast multi-domain protein [Stylonychia lemnae]|eukprot:CDW74865.1 cast multi-domain protein [Stylonychia lemnae]